MSKTVAQAFATVIFALYDEAPIACQGDDDKKKIRVITNSLAVGDDIHGDALKRSLEPIPVGRVSCGGGDLRTEQGAATRHSELWQGAATQCRVQSAPSRRLGLLE
jgi:hypothetical protein